MRQGPGSRRRDVHVLATGILFSFVGFAAGHHLALAETAVLQVPRAPRPLELADLVTLGGDDSGGRVTEFRQRNPGDGVPAGHPTSVSLAYDSKNLYVGFVCGDDPAQIRAHLARREDILADDAVAVYLDTFRDHRHAYVFSVNPLGIQRDAIMTEGQDEDPSFDTVWYSDGRLTSSGYMVIMTIPFKSLRFPDSEGQTWGIALGRTIPRDSEESYWPLVSRRYSGFIQQFATLQGLDTISPGRNLQLIPFGMLSDARFLDRAVPAFRTSFDRQAGLDTKLVLRDALALDVTVNPDFSQVESDEPQVTVNQRFEVRYPEKRPFFIENAGYFQTPISLFFSRRIVDPQFGGRLTGKLGKWAVGALGADDEAPGAVIPAGDPGSGERAGIGALRLQREIGDQSTVGVLATSRDFSSSSNRVLALDTLVRLNPTWTLSAQAALGATRSLDGTTRTGPAYYAELKRDGRGLDYDAIYTDFDPDFRAPLGFVKRVDMRQVEQTVEYRWWPEGGRVVKLGPTLTTLANWDHQGRLQDWLVDAQFKVETIGRTEVELGHSEAMERLDEIDFRKQRTTLTFTTEWLEWLALSLSYEQGTGVNLDPPGALSPFLGNARDASVVVTIRPTPQIRLDQTYLLSSMRSRNGSTPHGLPDSTRIFSDHLVRWKLSYQASARLSLRAIIDYGALLPNASLSSLERAKSLRGDFLVTYLVNPGTAIYVGYTDLYENVTIGPGEPPVLRSSDSPRTSTGRQFFMKVSYLWRH